MRRLSPGMGLAVLGLSVSAGAASCGSNQPQPLPATVSAPSASASVVAPVAIDPLPAETEARHPLGKTRPTPLPITSLYPVQGSESVLAVSQFAGERLSYFSRYDEAKAKWGSVVVLENEPIFASFARGEDLLVASRRDRSICLTTYRSSGETQRGCELDWGDVLVSVGDRFLALGAATPGEKVSKKAPPKEPEKPVAHEPPAKKKPKAPRAKVEPRAASAAKKLAVVRQFVSAAGTVDGEAEETDLEFVSPMPGMGLVGAASSGDRTRLMYYEGTGPAKNKSKTVIGRARLVLGSLDQQGKYDKQSKKELQDDDLMFGFLADHQDPRIVQTEHGALYVGLTSTHGKCEAAVVLPFFMQMIPDDPDCRFHPQRYFEIAGAVREAHKAGNDGGKTAMPGEPTVDARLENARRTYGQGNFDALRASFYGERSYALVGDEVVSFTDPAHAETIERPLVASRLRLSWGAFAPDGTGVGATEEGLVTIDAHGAVSAPTALTANSDPLRSLIDRQDFADRLRTPAVKIGDSFFVARRGLQRLTPTLGKIDPFATPSEENGVLVGGETEGWLLYLAGGLLSTSRVKPDGGLAVGAQVKSPIGFGFDATYRKGGGAIVAGRSSGKDRAVVALVIDQNGKPRQPVASGLANDEGDPYVRLTALPDGGALLTDFKRTEVVWLDNEAHPIGHARLDAGTSLARCIDGRPAPTAVPSPTPGEILPVKELALANTCVSGDPTWSKDGSLRWFGSAAVPPHIRAEVGIAIGLRNKPDTAPPPASPPLGLGKEIDPRRDRPLCDADMVLVRGSFCVDRFEGTLIDRTSQRLLSPDYSPIDSYMTSSLSEWATRRERVGDLLARAMPLPRLFPFELEGNLTPVAVNQMGVRPSGYVTGTLAKSACEAAHKRLCKLEEWQEACRGEGDTQFPYGSTYEHGVCNVNRESHPAAMLHGHSSMGHLDPRLDRVIGEHGPLMKEAGTSSRCVSKWGDDGIYDMVGNIDEWVDEESGAFAGGFFARGAKNGCDALVRAHPFGYLDYSTGIRCCSSVKSNPAEGDP